LIALVVAVSAAVVPASAVVDVVVKSLEISLVDLERGQQGKVHGETA
jgi:hypothetical protein